MNKFCREFFSRICVFPVFLAPIFLVYGCVFFFHVIPVSSFFFWQPGAPLSLDALSKCLVCLLVNPTLINTHATHYKFILLSLNSNLFLKVKHNHRRKLADKFHLRILSNLKLLSICQTFVYLSSLD